MENRPKRILKRLEYCRGWRTEAKRTGRRLEKKIEAPRELVETGEQRKINR